MVGLQQDLLDVGKADGESVGNKNAAQAAKVKVGPPKLKLIDRTQMVFRSVDVERLIEEDHRARVIWELTGQVDLTAFA